MPCNVSQPGGQQAAQIVQIPWRAGNRSRCHSNDVQPADNNLPQELFVQIIQEVYWLIQSDVARSEWGTNWTSPYQLVCRCWRDVIRSTPWFWSQKIRVSRSPEWLELCLARCAGSPAKVCVFSPHSPSATFATLRRYASSIQACDIFQFQGGDASCLDGLSSLFAMSMPSLETLSVGTYKDKDIVDVTTFAHNLFPPPQDPQTHLLFGPSRYGAISYVDFLEVMGQCRELETLNLDAVLLYQFHGTISSAVRSRSLWHGTLVVLPRLQVMGLCGPREVMSDLLGTLHAPLFTTISAAAFIDPWDPGPRISQLLVPNLQLRHTFLRNPTSVSITCLDRGFELLLGAKTAQQLFVGIHVNDDQPGWSANLEPSITAAMDTFSFDQIDTLRFDGLLEEVPASVWQRVFQACRKLRALHLRGRGTIHSVWQGLWRATLPSPAHDGVLCCPLLVEITMNEYRPETPFIPTPTLFETMRGTLRARADQHGTRIQKLQMYVGYTDELWRETAELRDAFVEDMRALVEELYYQSVRL